MSTAIRKTINIKNEKKDNMLMQNSSEIPKDFFKKLKLVLENNTANLTIIPSHVH
jgi:hypothetical protein